MTKHIERTKGMHISSPKIAFRSKKFQNVSKPSLKLKADPPMTSDLILEKLVILICGITNQKMGASRDMLGLGMVMTLMMKVTISKLLILFWLLFSF